MILNKALIALALGRTKMTSANPMTAPDSRDSVERIVAEMREMADWPHATADRMDLFRWADRLSALPQQAGGEDVEDAARYRWLVACGKFVPSVGPVQGWGLGVGARNPSTKSELDAAIDAALNGGQDDA